MIFLCTAIIKNGPVLLQTKKKHTTTTRTCSRQVSQTLWKFSKFFKKCKIIMKNHSLNFIGKR